MGVLRVIRDEEGNEVGSGNVEAEEKGRAFKYYKAAMSCQHRFRDSHVAMLVLRCLVEHTDYKTGKSWPGYETLMYESGTSNRTLVADILKRFEQVGIIPEKQKRMNNSTVYTLSLERMHELRMPRLNEFQEGVINRMNEVAIAWVRGVEETKLTQDAILAVDDDKYIFEVMNWWLGRQMEEGDVRKSMWLNWLNDYPVIRSAYFKERLLEDEPELAPFKLLNLSYSCAYCHEMHISGCSPEAVAAVKKDKKKKAPKESAITFENDPDDYVDGDLVGENFDIEEV